jgi:chromosome segregation ATPase
MKRTVAVGVLVFTAAFGLRAVGQDNLRRQAQEEQRRVEEEQRRADEAQRREAARLQQLDAEREAAKLQEVQRSILAKANEIRKVLDELKALKAQSAELEKRRAELETTLKSLRVQLDQEETAFRDKAERIGAWNTVRGRGRDDQGRGMEEKLDAILKKLESMEKRLSDLEKKAQPDRPRQ